MKEITVYEAQDGKRFSSEKKCLDYEADGCVEFRLIPKYGDHVPLTESELRWMLHGDGSCYYATSERMSRVFAHSAPHPDWATHLVYFGK